MAWINTSLIASYDFLVFNATFNNISAISWRSVLLVEETRVPGEHHQPVASHSDSLIGVYKIKLINNYSILYLTTGYIDNNILRWLVYLLSIF